MDDHLTVRSATSRDDAALLTLDAAAWDPGTGFPSVQERPRTSFFADAEPAGTLVAERDGRILGYLSSAPPTALPENAHVAAISGLAVDPRHRGEGVGRQLLSECVRRARHRGATKVSLRVLATNEAAMRVYRAAGFEVEGVLAGEFVVDGEPVDDVLMARSL